MSSRAEKNAKYAAKVNEQLVMICPELASEYAKYPLSRDRWLNFDETIDGKTVFLESSEDAGLKMKAIRSTAR